MRQDKSKHTANAARPPFLKMRYGGYCHRGAPPENAEGPTSAARGPRRTFSTPGDQRISAACRALSRLIVE
jgi:hypothetical protein